ncbi:MAG: polysaccharide deacetylase family protein [Bacteroidota bacterium]
MSVIVYANKKTSRLIYTLDVIFKWIYTIDYQLTSDPASYQNNLLPKLNYSNTPLAPQEVRITPDPLLFEHHIRPVALSRGQIDQLPTFFQQKDAPDALPFDPIACIFFWVSRYEEYLPFQADTHGRFPATESAAFQQQLLHLPVAQMWAHYLITQLQSQFPAFQPTPPRYRFQPTYDIDLAYAYRHKPLLRLAASLLKQVLTNQWPKARYQYRVYKGRLPDPYDTFSFLETLHQQYGLSPIFFFLLATYRKNDNNLPHDIPAMRELIQQLSQSYRLGIHPSIRSNKKPKALAQEIQRLYTHTSTKVLQSRQHYLILRFPHTYEQLIQHDIIADHSLGFASQTGFRAGIALPYPWFNLRTNQVTPLLLHPFQVMDVTLKQYLQLSPEAAIEHIQAYIQTLQQYGGTFTTLWHNSSFAEHEGWQGWKSAYAKILALAP